MTSLSPQIRRDIRCAADMIRDSQRAVALTGAGISTPSGIPDFRSTGSGLWTRYDPFEVASLSAFRYEPQRFYDWIRPLARDMRDAHPNPAHIGLAELEQAGRLITIITQNIDGLHHRAGSKHILEVHGSFRTLTCTGCFQQHDSADFLEAFLELGETPHCRSCQHILKPDVVLMGEQLPVKTWLKAQEESKRCDLMIVAGSSLEILPAAGLPMRAIDHGAHLIVINQSETYIDVRADIVIQEDVAEIIPRIVKEVFGD